MEETARGEEAPLISLPNGSAKKKFRARKTMTASCRQQLATLKVKNSPKCENALEEPSNKAVQQPELICETNFTAPENPASKLNKSQGVFPNGLKVSIEVSQVDSEINIGCSYNETWKGISEKSQDVPFSHTTHFVVRDFNAAATESHFSDLDQVSAPTNSESQDLSKETLQSAESTVVHDVKTQSDIDCSSISDNLNASITVKIIDEDKSFEKTSSIDIVAPGALPDLDSAAVPQDEPEPSTCTSDGHNALTCPSSLTSVSESDQPKHNEEAAAATGDSHRKRTCSESSDIPEAKRPKTSNSVLLDEIQCLIDKRVNILFEDMFDQKMQTLIRQADLVRKKGNRTIDVARHLRSIKRLHRRLKCAIHLQKQLGACSTTLTPIESSPEELHNTEEAADASEVLPPAEATESFPSTASALNPTTSNTDLVVLSDNEAEKPSNPEEFQTESPSNESKKVDSTAIQKIMESIKEHRKKARSSKTGKKVKTVIDLTDEEQKLDKGRKKDREHQIPNGDVSAPATSPKENIGAENVFDKYSFKKGLESSNTNETSLSCDVNEGNPSIPKSPQSENLQESVPSVKASSPDPSTLKPPQKPQLRLAQVQNPKGIALSWNITNVDPSCAPAKAYCLYVHQGDPDNTKKLWKKIGEIKALPLPMACTLTQFVEDNTYSFAMRAKDANGRFGPLCDIQSTTLKSVGSSKKS